MLLFLHGFLGDVTDWDEVISYLPPSLDIQALGLPGHGNTPIAKDIALDIHQRAPRAKMIVGYSAGGRIALELKNRYPKNYEKIALISSHLGLSSEKERKKRIESDQKWIEILKKEPIETFLKSWYNQPLFQSLKNHPSFPTIIERRKRQNPKGLALFLERYGLGKTTKYPLVDKAIYIHGKKDLKYAKHFRRLSVFAMDAGHAIHLENPKELAKCIYEYHTKSY